MVGFLRLYSDKNAWGHPAKYCILSGSLLFLFESDHPAGHPIQWLNCKTRSIHKVPAPGQPALHAFQLQNLCQEDDGSSTGTSTMVNLR